MQLALAERGAQASGQGGLTARLVGGGGIGGEFLEPPTQERDPRSAEPPAGQPEHRAEFLAGLVELKTDILRVLRGQRDAEQRAGDAASEQLGEAREIERAARGQYRRRIVERRRP